jgi:hypothetical protein
MPQTPSNSANLQGRPVETVATGTLTRSPHGGPQEFVRAPAKAEVFVEGDHVVYPTHGVGKV